MKSERKPVGPTFHRTFPLQRPVLSAYLQALAELGPKASDEELRSKAKIGTIKVPASRGFGRATGLLGWDSSFTPLGRVVLEKDPDLLGRNTLWMLHTGLCGLSLYAPTYWSALWRAFSDRLPIDRSRMIQVVRSVYSVEDANDRALDSCVGVFVATYRNSDGLSALGLLTDDGGQLVASPERRVIPLGVFAVALALRWRPLHSGLISTDLAWFEQESQLGEFFQLGPRGLRRMIERCAELGVVELYTISPPYTLVRKWQDETEVLAHLYRDE